MSQLAPIASVALSLVDTRTSALSHASAVSTAACDDADEVVGASACAAASAIVGAHCTPHAVTSGPLACPAKSHELGAACITASTSGATA